MSQGTVVDTVITSAHQVAEAGHGGVVPIMLLTGLFTLVAYYMGKLAKLINLPSLIGYMITGVIFGNYVSQISIGGWEVGHEFTVQLSFLTDLVLAFVAMTIGLELSFGSLKKQGTGIIAVIFTESFMAFLVVSGLIYWVSGYMPIPDSGRIPLALIFGSIAPASAPAGTVAIIQEYRAKGPLTKALYAVVGFDDGLGIIIFGFAAAFSRSMLQSAAGADTGSLLATMMIPLREVFLSIGIGVVLGLIYAILGRKIKRKQDLLILTFVIAMLGIGLAHMMHLSLILTNMVVGMIIVNTQPHGFVNDIHDGLAQVMPLMYILFFSLAGANLHVAALPSLGMIGLVYILGRSFGLVSGARLGSILGKMPDNIRKYLGMGILSQAGVAIGLSLMVKKDFEGLGLILEDGVSMGTWIGVTVLTTVTATSIVFEIIGPILTKIALTKAGEIEVEEK